LNVSYVVIVFLLRSDEGPNDRPVRAIDPCPDRRPVAALERLVDEVVGRGTAGIQQFPADFRVVEVADTSPEGDQTVTLPLYAKAAGRP
jgi:hypothetical protein